jgi:Laminin G domain
MVPTRLMTVAVGMVAIVAAMQGVSAAATDATPVMRQATLAIGDWPMNETSGQTMVDVSGNALDGYIGSSVLINVPTDDGTGYRFQGPLNVQNRERLVLVDDTPMLDPGTEAYSVSVRFRTFGSRPNILQKGQSEDTGGYWKLVIHTGWPRCHYRDENYNTKAIGFVRSPDPNAKVNDGDWHTLRCQRNLDSVCVYLDEGTPTAMSRCIRGAIGLIDNKWPLSIGGKMRCDPLRASTTCDYFNGDIDWVRIERP